MSMETHSALWSVPSKEGAELGITKHLSDDRLEVYIPKEAEVQCVRAQALPPGMRKKMGLLSTARASDADHVTWISPVVVRERGLSPSPLKAPPLSRTALASLTMASKAGSSSLSGWSQYWLPVVCSSLPAFKVLRKFMPNGNSQTPNLKQETRQPACASRRRPLCFSQDAIIIRQSQIFLSVKKSGPGRKREEPTQTSLIESPSSLLQQGGVCVPRCPKDSQLSLDPSAVPPLKASQCPVSLRTLCLQFGVERRARVTVAGLPDEVLKTLSAIGFVDLKNEPTATRLFRKDEHRKLESFGQGYSDGSSRNCCAQDLTASQRSRDGMMGGAFHKDNIMGGKGTREPVSKKARRASHVVGEVKGGDVDAIGVNGGDICTHERDRTKISILKVDGGELCTDEPQVVDVGTVGVKDGDLCTDEVKDGDLGTFGVKDGDLCTDEVKDGDFGTFGVKDGDLCSDEFMDGNLGTFGVKDGDLCTDEVKDGDLGTFGVKDGDLCTDEVKDGDLGTFGVKDGDLCSDEVMDGDLGTFGVKDGDLCTDEVKDGDVGTIRVDGGDVHIDEVKDGDLGSLGVDGGDVHIDEVKDGDLCSLGVDSGDVHTEEVEGGDWTSCKAEDEGHYTVDRDDLDAWEVLGGDGSAGEDISPEGTLEPEEAYLLMPCLEYATGFDFDQSARDERINRIRAQLREKQAALLMLKLSPFE